MSKQPDRFERVAHILVQKLMGAEVFEFNGATLDQVENAEALVVTLLCREQAAVRKLVRGLACALDGPLSERQSGYLQACKFILAALDTRRK